MAEKMAGRKFTAKEKVGQPGLYMKQLILRCEQWDFGEFDSDL
jgi:hypothetical protein